MNIRKLLCEKNSGMHAHFISTLARLEETFLRGATLPHFTSHGADHSAKIENVIDKLLPDSVKAELNAKELYILLMGIFFHDIGMAVTLSGDEQLEDESKAQYETRLDGIRRTHSDRAYRFMMEKHEQFGIDRGVAQAIAHICLAHSDLKPVGGPRVRTFEEHCKHNAVRAVQGDDVRIHFLAALLRLADELDLDYVRASGDMEQMRDMPAVSRREWMKHQLISGVKIDSEKFEIFLDIFEGDLYGDEAGSGEETAQRNEGITEVVIKLRRVLAEVSGVLCANGAKFTEVLFRDPIVLQLGKLLDQWGIRSAAEAQFSILHDEVGAQAGSELFRCEVEGLPLSPDLFLSSNLDFIVGDDPSLLSDCREILGQCVPEPCALPDADAVPELVGRVLTYLNEYDALYILDKEDFLPRPDATKPDETMDADYAAILRGLMEALLENSEFQRFQKDLDRKVRRIIRRFGERALPDDADLDSLAKGVINSIADDLLRLVRRRRLEEKSASHFVHIVFCGDLFYRQREHALRRGWSSEERVAATLAVLRRMDTLIRDLSNIRLYYYEGRLTSEMHVLSSELAIVSGPTTDSLLVVRDVNRVVEFYDEAMAVLESPDTWQIEGFDEDGQRLRLAKEDAFHASDDPHRLNFRGSAEERLAKRIAALLE